MQQTTATLQTPRERGRKPPHAPYSPMGQSHMLGSTRSTVTLAAGRLKEEKLITYKRAEIAIVDRKGLEKRACECYGIIKQHLDDFAAFDTDDTK